jgi:hypothetical protein
MEGNTTAMVSQLSLALEVANELTDQWIHKVWLICVASKSSNLLLAPGTNCAGVMGFFDFKQRTALLYAMRSFRGITLLKTCE